jgi:hypothetical protein
MDYWNKFSEAYQRYDELFSMQSSVTLALHTKANEALRILEVGCGPGLHSLVLAKTML